MTTLFCCSQEDSCYSGPPHSSALPLPAETGYNWTGTDQERQIALVSLNISALHNVFQTAHIDPA